MAVLVKDQRSRADNHEYHTPNAAGYFGYFGAAAGDPAKGYYSYDLGGWHVVVLNSNCSRVGGCGPGSPQERWLREDLAASKTDCTLAYWHHARFSSGAQHGGDARMTWFWQALYDNGADVVLSAHNHTYERFAPQTPAGVADAPFGIREFVVGTGGALLHTGGTAIPNGEVRNSNTHGILKLTLRASSYAWEFLPVAGRTFTDSGSGACHGAPAPGELLGNGSFENGLDGWGGWQATLAEAPGHQGTRAARVTTSTGSGVFAMFTHPRPISPAPPGVAYRTSAWVRSERPGRAVCLLAREWTGGSIVDQSETCRTSTTSWQQLSLTYTTKGSDSLELALYQPDAQPGDSFDVDDATLVSGGVPPPPPPGELLPNGSFENGLSGWGGWQAGLDLVPGTEGAQAARVTASRPGVYALFTTPRPVSPTSPRIGYRASAWIRSSGSSGPVCLLLREWSGGTIVREAESCRATTADWQQVAVTYTTIGADSLEFLLYQAGAQAGQNFDVDGASLVSTGPSSELLPNGSFESGLSGWGAWRATLALVPGTDGAQAARVTSTGSGVYALFTHPRPVNPSDDGIAYRASALVRSERPGAAVCLLVREWAGTTIVRQGESCATTTTAWQQLTLAYTSIGANSLEVVVYQNVGQVNDSFDVDGASLTLG